MRGLQSVQCQAIAKCRIRQAFVGRPLSLLGSLAVATGLITLAFAVPTLWRPDKVLPSLPSSRNEALVRWAMEIGLPEARVSVSQDKLNEIARTGVIPEEVMQKASTSDRLSLQIIQTEWNAYEANPAQRAQAIAARMQFTAAILARARQTVVAAAMAVGIGFMIRGLRRRVLNQMERNNFFP